MKNKFCKFWNEFLDIISRREMSILPAHLAYYFLISIIPAFTLFFFIAGSFNLSTHTISDFMTSVFSENVTNMILNSISKTSLSFSNISFILIAFFVTSNGAKSIIVASNTIFNIQSSNIIKRRIKAFMITIFLILLLTFILVVPLFGNSILKLFALIGIDNEIVNVINIIYPILKWPLTLFIVFLFIKIIYTMAPDEKVSSSFVNRGTLFTTLGWSIITGCYSFYINNIANYSRLYGALANIVILMLWFWLLSYVFVIGLVLNYKSVEEENEKTNTIKLKEIQEKVKNSQNTKLKN